MYSGPPDFDVHVHVFHSTITEPTIHVLHVLVVTALTVRHQDRTSDTCIFKSQLDPEFFQDHLNDLVVMLVDSVSIIQAINLDYFTCTCTVRVMYTTWMSRLLIDYRQMYMYIHVDTESGAPLIRTE